MRYWPIVAKVFGVKQQEEMQRHAEASRSGDMAPGLTSAGMKRRVDVVSQEDGNDTSRWERSNRGSDLSDSSALPEPFLENE